ncbi:MAG: mitochondrial fission ELM1 family protein [Pseudomonadota bacterium]
MTRSALKIAIITDGKMGDLAQCRGVAQAIAAPENISEISVRTGWYNHLPAYAASWLPTAALPIEAAKADIVIASGRRTLPALIAVKRKHGPLKAPFVAFLKTPPTARTALDFIWAPRHDGLAARSAGPAPDVFSTLTSPHTITSDILGELRGERNIPGRQVGVILGGNNKSVTWNAASADEFAALLAQVEGDRFTIVSSRRTPDILMSAVSDSLAGRACDIWDGTGENPYQKVLATSDAIIVTGDSHNMVSEACATGAQILVYQPPGLQPKLKTFLQAMQAEGHIADIAAPGDVAALSDAKTTPVDATPDIAAALLKAFDARKG